MNNYCAVLAKKIKTNRAKICVIGLGYVGLPLAVALGNKKFFVYGFDTNYSRIHNLKKGKRYIVDVAPEDVLELIRKKRFFPTVSKKVLADADVIIVCVPTPLRKVKIPDISYIVQAAKTIKLYLRKNQLIILESTSFPTTTREVVLPILKEAGLKEERDFFLCFSPERVNPGDAKYSLVKIPKIVGGLSKASSALAKALYKKIINKVVCVSSPEVAESAKLLENTFRLVNIALANEFAMVAHRLGISVWEIIEAAKTKPFGYMPFYPGPGCGGHCIPDDPLYLAWKAKKLGFKTKMIDLASKVNHFMPGYIVNRLEELLSQRGIALSKAKVLIMGVTYKRDVKDLRESPALDIIGYLRQKKVRTAYFDPLIPYLDIRGLKMSCSSLSPVNLKRYDCVVIVTNHTNVDYTLLQKQARCIFDTRNVYTKDYANVVKL